MFVFYSYVVYNYLFIPKAFTLTLGMNEVFSFLWNLWILFHEKWQYLELQLWTEKKTPAEMMSKVRQVFLLTLDFSSEGSFVTLKLINDDLPKNLKNHTAVNNLVLWLTQYFIFNHDEKSSLMMMRFELYFLEYNITFGIFTHSHSIKYTKPFCFWVIYLT